MATARALCSRSSAPLTGALPALLSPSSSSSLSAAVALVLGQRRSWPPSKASIPVVLPLPLRPDGRRPFASSASATSSSSSSPPPFRPDDGEAAFARSSTGRLFLSWSLLETCRLRPLTALGAGAFSWAASPGAGALGVPLLWLARNTAFAHFCGGERLEECVDVAKALAAYRIRCIVDWSIEEDEDERAWDANAKRKAELISRAAEGLGPRSAAFVPVKLTALLSPALLERVTAAAGGTGAAFIEDIGSLGLTPEDLRQFEESVDRLGGICVAARAARVPLLLDAEQSHRQPAVHAIARELMRRFNTGGEPVVYDTVQMYLSASTARLSAAAAAAQAEGYTFAVKLVRGAYIAQEQPLGTTRATKEATDAAYDTAAAELLRTIAAAPEAQPPPVALLVATHNRASLERAVGEMERLGMRRDCPQVHFAHIMGMVDNLTNALGLAGYNATKLVVFGNIREVLPWLLRRVQENRDAFGAQAVELPVLRAELRRRLASALGLRSRSSS